MKLLNSDSGLEEFGKNISDFSSKPANNKSHSVEPEIYGSPTNPKNGKNDTYLPEFRVKIDSLLPRRGSVV